MAPKRHSMHLAALALCFGLLWAMTFAAASSPASAAAADGVTVFAAASLKTALDAAAEAWSAATGHRTRIAYAASSALARQIEHGAPVDIYLSANVRWMDYLDEKGLIEPTSRRALFGNSLVLIAPTTSRVALTISPSANLAAALGDGRLALAHTTAVPAGLYARQALTHLGLWRQVRTRLAEAQNVRAALALVARGEAPLGIVYATDANAEPAVRVVDTFPAASHDPIVYPAALVRGGRREPAAEFLDFLTSEAGAQHFLAQGFVQLR